jgi:hypothetical protein
MSITMTSGKLAYEFSKVRLPLQVLKSAAGFYLGTFDEGGPVSRESVEYWAAEGQAEKALASGEWTQREAP